MKTIPELVNQARKQVDKEGFQLMIEPNTLHCGDNLTLLREMESRSIDLICTDPPFNTGRDWGAFNDKWEGGLKGYLAFMEPRLVECHRVLKETGSFYLHCNPTASHYLKVMLDTIFRIKQFRNEIVWKRKSGRSNDVRSFFAKEHDIILFYSKTDQYVFHPIRAPLTPKQIASYKKTDEKGRKYQERGPDTHRKNRTRFYLDDNKGIALDTLWTKACQLSGWSKERLGYPTQKPVALYERMIKASSHEGDIVLDPFCGSGTTLDAAQTLGRRWIGIDKNPEAIALCERRLTRHNSGSARRP